MFYSLSHNLTNFSACLFVGILWLRNLGVVAQTAASVRNKKGEILVSKSR